MAARRASSVAMPCEYHEQNAGVENHPVAGISQLRCVGRENHSGWVRTCAFRRYIDWGRCGLSRGGVLTGLTDIKVGEIRTLVRIFATLALGFFEVRLINTYAYPLYLGVHTYLREAVSLSSLVLYFVIALLAYRWSRVLSERRILGATVSGLALGACLLAIALAVRAPGVIAVGAIVFGIARASAELLAAMALTTIGPARSLPMLVCALIAAYVPEGALSVLPFAWGFGLYLAVPLLFLATGWPVIRQALGRWGDASAAGGAARDHAVTEPGAFLPFSHRFFCGDVRIAGCLWAVAHVQRLDGCGSSSSAGDGAPRDRRAVVRGASTYRVCRRPVPGVDTACDIWIACHAGATACWQLCAQRSAHVWRRSVRCFCAVWACCYRIS